MCDPTLEAPTRAPLQNPYPATPLLRTLPAARHHIPMVTPLLSLLIKIRDLPLCAHTAHAHSPSQQVAGLARHSRPTSKVKHTAGRPLFLCCFPKGGREGERVRRRGQDKRRNGKKGGQKWKEIKGSVSAIHVGAGGILDTYLDATVSSMG